MIPNALRDSVCRWLSKSGTLAAHAAQLRALACDASSDEIVAFYSFLRDSSQRWESEWRSQFTTIFSISDDALPPIDDAERWPLILHTLIEQGDAQGVRVFLEGIGVPRWDFAPVEAEIELDIYPIDARDDSGVLPSEKARQLGFLEIANHIDSLKESVASRYRERHRIAYGNRG